MRTARFTGLGVGSTSIVMIFVVLCLTTFSTLSYVSTRVSTKLIEKNIAHIDEYYQADTSAKETLAEIDNTIYLSMNSKDYELNLTSAFETENNIILTPQNNGYSIAYSIYINETQTLDVELLAPIARSTKRYEVLAWKVNTANSDNLTEDDLNLWDGNF